MFDELSSRFEDAVKGLRGEAKISENNIAVSYTHLTLPTTPYV